MWHYATPARPAIWQKMLFLFELLFFPYISNKPRSQRESCLFSTSAELYQHCNCRKLRADISGNCVWAPMSLHQARISSHWMASVSRFKSFMMFYWWFMMFYMCFTMYHMTHCFTSVSWCFTTFNIVLQCLVSCTAFGISASATALLPVASGISTTP